MARLSGMVYETEYGGAHHMILPSDPLCYIGWMCQGTEEAGGSKVAKLSAGVAGD